MRSESLEQLERRIRFCFWGFFFVLFCYLFLSHTNETRSVHDVTEGNGLSGCQIVTVGVRREEQILMHKINKEKGRRRNQKMCCKQ